MDFHPVLLCPKKNIGTSGEGFKNGVTNLLRKKKQTNKIKTIKKTQKTPMSLLLFL